MKMSVISEVVVICLACLLALTSAQLGLHEEGARLGVHSRSRQLLHTRFQQTREELAGELDCREECRERRREPVCGTNGHTYTSLCDLHRHMCKRVKVTLKHHGECSLAEKCLDERRAKQELVASGESVYVPTCLEDGSYSPVQCHNFTSYCWCSRLDGKPIPDTITQDRNPKCRERGTPQESTSSTSTQERCNGRTRRTFITNLSQHLVQEYSRERPRRRTSEERMRRKALKWKFARLDGNRDGRLRRRESVRLKRTVRKFIKPKKCAKKFPRLCDADGDHGLTLEEWMSCFTLPKTGRRGGRRCNNSPCRSNKQVTTEAPPSCLRDQAEAGTGGSNNSIPVLACQPDGRYQPIQCHKNICICVDEWTGSSLDGTGIQNGTPDCSRPLPHARVWPGCTGRVKSKFMQDLKKFLLSKVEGGERSTGPDSAGQSVEQFAALTHFRSLDHDSNSFLERREKKAVKRLFRSNPKLRACGKNLTKYCDVNRDRKVSQEEWLACVTLHNNQTDEPRPPPPPGGDWNPFEHILKSES